MAISLSALTTFIKIISSLDHPIGEFDMFKSEDRPKVLNEVDSKTPPTILFYFF